MSKNLFEEYVGNRVVVIYTEEKENKSLIGDLKEYQGGFLVIEDDYGNDVLIHQDTIRKLKIKGGEDNGYNSPQ